MYSRLFRRILSWEVQWGSGMARNRCRTVPSPDGRVQVKGLGGLAFFAMACSLRGSVLCVQRGGCGASLLTAARSFSDRRVSRAMRWVGAKTQRVWMGLLATHGHSG